jgi:hypothetical protein
MHNLILKNTRVVLGANFFLSVIEVNIMNDQHGGQCGVHVLCHERVALDSNLTNFETCGSRCKWVCLSCDRDFVFQGVHVGDFTFKFKVVLFLIGVHCITH